MFKNRRVYSFAGLTVALIVSWVRSYYRKEDASGRCGRYNADRIKNRRPKLTVKWLSSVYSLLGTKCRAIKKPSANAEGSSVAEEGLEPPTRGL